MGELSLAFAELQPCSRPVGSAGHAMARSHGCESAPPGQLSTCLAIQAFLDHRRAPHGWLAAFGQAFLRKSLRRQPPELVTHRHSAERVGMCRVAVL